MSMAYELYPYPWLIIVAYEVLSTMTIEYDILENDVIYNDT